MNDFEDEYIWCVVRKANGGAAAGALTLAMARRIIAEDSRFFVARWQVPLLQWFTADEHHEPPPPGPKPKPSALRAAAS